MGDIVSGLAAAIQQMEGWFPGSLSYRNNNPGNLRPGSLAVGAVGSSGGYAVFPDYATGYAALTGLIQSPGYWNLTLTQFFAKYAPSADNNNPAAYAASVANMLGVDPNTPISQLAAGDGGSPSGGSDTGGGSDTSTDTGSSLLDAFSGLSPVALGVILAAAALAVAL